MRLGKTPGGMLPGQFTTPHGIAVDSQSNIYVGELSGRSWSRFSKDPVPVKRRVIHRRAQDRCVAAKSSHPGPTPALPAGAGLGSRVSARLGGLG
ncbi:MAG: SBBP repeat-containing protein [Alphaproteobacteria bacterium]|nr:SBBP repeat-containing protein [Alphaproteobacteria bacterium]